MMSAVKLTAALLMLGAMVLWAQDDARVRVVDGLDYVWMERGAFLMGCGERDAECFDWEPAGPWKMLRGTTATAKTACMRSR